MTASFAGRVWRVQPSATLAISDLADDLAAEGHDVVDLSVGEPDFSTPENVVDVGKAAMDAGHTGYAPTKGVPELRTAIAESLQDDGLTQYDAENVVVTPGAKQALFETFQTLVEDGDEVVLLDPAWVSYEAMAKLAGANLTRIDTAAHGFRLEPALDDLEDAVDSDTELLVLNSPSNPAGAVYDEEAYSRLRDVVVTNDVTVVSDEIYREIHYGDRPVSAGTIPGLEHRTVTVNGFSKAYSMTGWRLGYLAAEEEVVEQVAKVQSHSVSSATNFVQRAGVEALRNCDDAVVEMRETFRERRDLLVDRLSTHGVDPPVPDGAFYLMLPVDEECPALADRDANLADTADEVWAEAALEEAHVATVPGNAFGTPGYVRLSYAASAERLREAVDRLAESGFL